ncbi:MAG: EAL domain-containing protein [Motiliproteus sp.]|nr:EAL domain-containing protein [Motiliproteus sp.]MCW9053402.1 EAL domain-containing protein [Motiliproteus sp.]
MGLLASLSIRKKLLIIPLLPLLLVSYFVTSAIYEHWQQTQAMVQLQRHFEVVADATDLVHELQIERGLSAAVVGANDKNLKYELGIQRKTVDRLLETVEQKLKKLDRSALNPGFRRQLDYASGLFGDLNQIRPEVDHLSVSLNQVLNVYTRQITALLELVTQMATHSDSVAIANQASAYFFFLLSKERAGVERALLSNAFAKDHLNTAMRQQFHALLADQQSYLQVFEQYAGKTEIALVNTMLKDPVVEQVNKIRAVPLGRNASFGIDPREWFQMATLRINLMRSVKTQLGERLQASVNAHSNQAKSELILLMVISVFSVSATFLVPFVFLGAISNQLRSLSKAVSRVDEEGDLTIRARETSDDELGQLARSFNTMLEHLAIAEGKVRMLSQAVEQSPVSVIITDLDGNIEYVNQNFQVVTGYSDTEVIGENTRILRSGNTHPRIYREMWQTIIAGLAWEGEFQNSRKDGSVLWERVHIAPVIDDRGETHHFMAIKTDITESKQQQEQITYQAHFDALTGLPNRFLSLDRLSQLLSETKRRENYAAVLFVDLDGFKKINDSLGHEAGDKILMQTSERLLSGLREEDTVGRLGGDEFLVLLGDINDPLQARRVAEGIIDKFQFPFHQQGRELMVTASIGIAIYPDDGSTPAQLLAHADIAMYESKKAGRNTYHFFTESMNQSAARRLELEEQLHGALEREEFHICYQPMIDLNSRQIIGAEALLRWNNPSLGMVPPDEFIPLAEQSEAIIHLGQFVLKEAMQHAAHWRKRYREAFSIAVNVSPRQFRDHELTQLIRDQLQLLDLPGDSLELEITEGVLMSGNTELEAVLKELHKLDVGIAMDDFGTGYSSLSYLRSYPFDTLKIDRSFINDIAVDSADRELVTAALSMGHGLGLKVVAEGVETEEQLDFLSHQGCDVVQGYLFGKPVVADDFEKLLRREILGIHSVS